MIVNNKRVVNIRNYLTNLPEKSKFRLIADVSLRPEAFLNKIGFSSPISSGDVVLPTPSGSISRFNAEGRWVRDYKSPKENRYIRTIEWSWKQWAGRGHVEEHTEYRDIYRMCYPRDLVPPPSFEIMFIQSDGRKLIASPELTNIVSEDDTNKHILNLFLELFGICEIVTSEMQTISPPVTKNVNWKILPPGKYPWSRLEEHIDAKAGNVSESTKAIIWDRQEHIKSHSPAEVFVGQGGFNDYIAYQFKDKGLVVLESVRHGNAIYIFDSNWKEFSKLTKAQILANNLQLHRIVHSSGWKAKLNRALSSHPSAQKAQMTTTVKQNA